VRIERNKLSEGNLRALDLYQLLARRVVVDFHLAPLAFDIIDGRMTQVDARALFDQLHLIHETRCPPPPTHG